MSTHVGYVVKVIKLKPHPNADRLQIATFFGNDTCVGLDVVKGEIGIYFPTDLQLSEEFCDANHLCRKTVTGEPDTGYMDRDKRNVQAIKLRGYKSDGIFLSLSCLTYTGVDMDTINIGDTVDVVNGHEICHKYIPRGRNNRVGKPNEGNHTRKHKEPIAPLFAEHADTEQLAYNLGAFKEGDLVEITLKMHGTSQRTGYMPMFQGYKRTLLDKILRRPGKPIYDWGYVSGTRRTILNDWDGGFYGSNEFRKQHADFFEGKLHKGEEVYYEVVGFTDTGVPIMGDGNNKKLNDKEFVKQYGNTTTFSYGCDSRQQAAKEGRAYIPEKPVSDFYVYRMTMTNEDGDVVEYTPDFMRYRCEQMGCKYVPVLWQGYLREPDDWCGDPWSPGDYARIIAEQYYDGIDPIGKTHIREGVVCRIVNRPKFCAYKHKNFEFKCISGIIAETITDSNFEISEEILAEL